MGTKTITKYVSDMDEQEIAAGQAYQLTIRHPDGSTQQLDISAQNYKGLSSKASARWRKSAAASRAAAPPKSPPAPPAPADVGAGRPTATPNLPPPELVQAVLRESLAS
jgi:hypothetical protein